LPAVSASPAARPARPGPMTAGSRASWRCAAGACGTMPCMDPTPIYYAIAALLALVGLAGIVIPALPGLPLLYAGMLLAAWADGFRSVGIPMLVVLGLLTLVSLLVDFWATAIGARRVGASRPALAGAVLGTLFGLFLGPFGILLGPFVG